MTFLSFLARALLLRRLFGHAGRSTHRPQRHAWRPVAARRHHRRGGFGFFGPVPHYSRRTRRGTTVGVSGCCLPIPIGFGVLVATGLRLLAARR